MLGDLEAFGAAVSFAGAGHHINAHNVALLCGCGSIETRAESRVMSPYAPGHPTAVYVTMGHSLRQHTPLFLYALPVRRGGAPEKCTTTRTLLPPPSLLSCASPRKTRKLSIRLASALAV